MEILEQERGGGTEGTFQDMVMAIARRPRVLPKDDSDDIIDLE